MNRDKRPLFRRNEMDERPNGWFAIMPIIPQIIIIAIVLGIYYYINLKGFFPLWTTYIYYGVKVIIALEIIIAAAKSLVGPLLAIAIGAVNLFWLLDQGSAFLTPDNAQQLLVMGVIGIVITFIVRSLRR